MTPQEAINILDQATGLAPLSRQAHQQVIEALQTLKALAEKTETPKEKK